MMIWRGIFAVLMLTVVLASAHTGGGTVAAPVAQVAAR
jgi:hypothetical protein